VPLQVEQTGGTIIFWPNLIGFISVLVPVPKQTSQRLSIVSWGIAFIGVSPFKAQDWARRTRAGPLILNNAPWSIKSG
jgi:hypothetical protein